MLTIYLFTVILYVNLCENEAGEDSYKLDFWASNPRFEARRANREYTEKQVGEEDKLGYKYSRPNPITRRRHNHTTAPKHRLWPNRHRIKRPHNTTEKGNLVWPRSQNLSQGEDDGDSDYSTRMTPIHLVHQTDKDPERLSETTSEKTGSAESSERLTPYALEKQMRDILSQYSEVNSSIEVIGRTVEYNDILLIKMSVMKNDMGKYFRADESKYIEEVPEKKIVFIVHCLSVLGIKNLAILNNSYYFATLLSYYIAHLDMFDIFFIPMANPDGYAASNSKQFWNKNMSPQSACPGVALDRNFDVAWNTQKEYSSCSQLYPGPAPFSEAETRAVRDVFHQYGHKIVAYIHVHPGTHSPSVFKGDAVLYPKGYSDIQCDDDKYIDLKGEIEETLKNASFQVITVTVDTLHNWYGRVYGSSVDYASTVYGIPYSLEFVMQLYKNDDYASDAESWVDHNALTEIWGRVIPVVFHNLWRNMHSNDVI